MERLRTATRRRRRRSARDDVSGPGETSQRNIRFLPKPDGGGRYRAVDQRGLAGDAYASRYGIVESLTDAVFVLQYVGPADVRETRLAVEIRKIRDANHSREKKPYEITSEGISVYQQANLF